MRRFDWLTNPEYSVISVGTLSIVTGPTQRSPIVPAIILANFNAVPVSELLDVNIDNWNVRGKLKIAIMIRYDQWQSYPKQTTMLS